MITMEMLGKIRRMHVRYMMSVRAIAKRTGLSQNTLEYMGQLLINDMGVAADRKLSHL